MRQRNKAFDMAGDDLVDTGCVVSGRITALSVTRPSAIAAVTVNRCIVLYPQYVAGESSKFGCCGLSTYPCWWRSAQCSPPSWAGGNSLVLLRLVVR